jgi:aldehyde dehydrogenase (NAD+)
MSAVFKHSFNHAGYKGDVEVPIGLFINGKYVASVDKNAGTIP